MQNRLFYSSAAGAAAQGNGPLARQLCAIARRRQLSLQQKLLQNGQVATLGSAPCPARPRPPG